jgi:hypothetical protein
MMNKLKPWLLLVLVFAAGVLAGIAGTRLAIHRAVANPQFLRERLERELVKELNLSPEQRAKVHQALLDSQSQINALRRDFQPRFVEILESTRKEIAVSLDPAQQEKLQRLIELKKQKWKLSAPEGPFIPRRYR